MTELDLQETRIDPRRTESFTDLRHDIGTFGPFYFLALLSVAGSLVPIKWLKAGMPLTTTALTAAPIS